MPYLTVDRPSTLGQLRSDVDAGRVQRRSVKDELREMYGTIVA